jgi:hypothetical protein
MSASTDLGKAGITVNGTWSGSVAYEKNSIVNDGANSYISIQDVPIGTALSNTAYWTLLCNGFSSVEVIDAVNDWLDDHPEATTTVQDGAITTAKVADGAITEDKLNLASYPDDLPKGYTRLLWIQSNGINQRINTGVNFTVNFGFEVDFITYSPVTWESGYGCILGSRVGSQNQELDLNTFKVTGLDGGIFRYGTSKQAAGFIVPNQRQVISWKNSEYVVDEVSKGTLATDVTNNGKAILLFALNDNGSPIQFSRTRLYSCKFYDGDTLVRNFVPASETGTNTIGMYDTVAGGFYKSSDGTDFEYMPYYAEVNYVNHLNFMSSMRIRDLLTTHAYIAANGKSAADNVDNRITRFIPVKKGQTIVYEGILVSNAAAAFAFYTNKSYASCQFVAPGLGYNVAPVNGEYTPATDGYFSIGSRQEYVNNAKVYFKDGFSDGDDARYEYLLSLHEDETIPSYWETEIATSEASYLNNEKTASPNSVSFSFITDLHWGTNAKNSPKIIKKLTKDLHLSANVFGGDIITNKFNNTGDAINQLKTFYAQFDDPYFATIGNHDNDSDHQTDTTVILSNGTTYNRIIKPTEKIKDSNTFHNIGCTYFDNESQKVRFIQFDSGTPMYFDGTTRTVDTTALIANLTKVGELVAELESDWTVILLTHQYWDPAHAGGSVTPNTYVSGYLKTYVLDVTHEATIACLVCGHIHRDADTTLSNTAGTETIRIISVTTDNCDPNQNQYGGPEMTLGTSTEQAFDLFQIDLENKTINATRVGAGVDRSWTY